jgi:ABC-type transporter Mla maintaining outer membrane lipid asymmetry permease subunit MlaE
VAAIHAAFYRLHPVDVAESGRETFAAFVALAVVVAGACLALGRRHAPVLMGALVTGTVALSYASQLLVLSSNFS